MTKTVTILGAALNPAHGQIELIEDVREKTTDGSRLVSRRWTGTTFPNNRKGQRAADEAMGAFNRGRKFA